MEHCGGPLPRVWMQIYTIYCQINDEVTNNSLELRSLTKSSWMRSNSAKLRVSSLFFDKYCYVIKNVIYDNNNLLNSDETTCLKINSK